jgi:hypothetical protein
MTSLRRASAVLLVPLLSACEIRVAEEEIQVRIDPKSDSLDLLLVYHGVSPNGKGRMADPAFRKRALEVIGGWELREHGSFLDEKNRLSAYQVFRVEKLSRLVDLANEAIDRGILDALDEGKAVPEGDEVDARTRELWKARAESGGPWIRLDGAEVVIDVPGSQEAFDRIRKEGLDEIREVFLEPGNGLEDRDPVLALAQLLLHVRRFEVGGDRIVLHLWPMPDGLFRFLTRCDREPYDPALLEAVRKEGIGPDPKLTLEEVRGKLGKAAPKPEDGAKKSEPGAKAGSS